MGKERNLGRQGGGSREEIPAPKVPQVIPSTHPGPRTFSYSSQQTSALRIHPPEMISSQTPYVWGTTPITEMPPPPMRHQITHPPYLPIPSDVTVTGSNEVSIGPWIPPSNAGRMQPPNLPVIEPAMQPPQDSSLALIKTWQASAGSDITSKEVGLIAQLLKACLDLFGINLRKASLSASLSVKHEKRLRRHYDTLKLWADGHNVFQGALDELLQTSKHLRQITLTAINSLCGILMKGLASSILSEEDRRAIINKTNAAVLYEQTRWIITESEDRLDDSDSESDNDSSSDTGHRDDMESIIEDIGIYTQNLVDLNIALECPAPDVDDPEETVPPIGDVSQRNAYDYYADLIVVKYPKADVELAKRLGKANWERYQRMQLARSGNLNPTSAADHSAVAKTHIAVSEFIDSGLGTSLPTLPSSYAETIMSFVSSLSGTKDKIPIPPLSLTAKKGEPFECLACGKMILIKTTREWRKHLFSENDLRPYTCFYPGCDFNLAAFRDRRAWSSHLELDHALGPLWESQQCVLCFESTGKGRNDVLLHYSRHMEEISCAALPRGVDSDEDSSNSSNPGSETTLQEMEEPGVSLSSQKRMRQRPALLIDSDLDSYDPTVFQDHTADLLESIRACYECRPRSETDSIGDACRSCKEYYKESFCFAPGGKALRAGKYPCVSVSCMTGGKIFANLAALKSHMMNEHKDEWGDDLIERLLLLAAAVTDFAGQEKAETLSDFGTSHATIGVDMSCTSPTPDLPTPPPHVPSLLDGGSPLSQSYVPTSPIESPKSPARLASPATRPPTSKTEQQIPSAMAYTFQEQQDIQGNFYQHYRQQQTPEGWQMSVPAKERAGLAVQFFTSWKLLKPEVKAIDAVRQTINFETHLFLNASSKDVYTASMRSHLQNLQQMRQQALQNAQPGMQPNNSINQAQINIIGAQGSGQRPESKIASFKSEASSGSIQEGQHETNEAEEKTRIQTSEISPPVPTTGFKTFDQFSSPERKRIPLKSCDSCFASKVRCHKERPICQRCSRLKITCIYGIYVTSRKRPKPGLTHKLVPAGPPLSESLQRKASTPEIPASSHPSNLPMLICPVGRCANEFSSTYWLDRHIREHHENTAIKRL